MFVLFLVRFVSRYEYFLEKMLGCEWGLKKEYRIMKFKIVILEEC